MKKIKVMLLAIATAASMLFAGCEERSGDVSIVFSYPSETLSSDAEVEEDNVVNTEITEVEVTTKADTKNTSNTDKSSSKTMYVAKIVPPTISVSKGNKKANLREEVAATNQQLSANTTTTTSVASSFRAEDAMIQNGEYYCQYTIKQGETYETLWYNFLVTQNQICAFNGINPNEYLQAGWVIYIPLDTYEEPSWWPYSYVPTWNTNYGSYDYTSNDSYNVWSGESNNENTSSYWNGGYDDGYVHSYTVTLYTSNNDPNAWHNIKLAASMLDGFCLEPGGRFNWFWDMGPCQYEQGFVDAGAYNEGGSAPGGGICFVATAFFQGGRGSGCSIIERHDHDHNYPPLSYAAWGDDAAISYGSCNLVFTNPSSTTGLRFSVYANECNGSITVTTTTY